MTTLGADALTLADWAKRLDPNGGTADIVELLSQTNEILTDMLWVQGNLPTGHRTTIRTGLPTVYWRLLNQGVAPSKSTTVQVDEACAKLEARHEVDKALADLNGNTSEFRLSEAKSFIEAMNQEMASTLFYGNSGTSPEEFTGLANRYADTSADNASNLIDGGGTGSDNSSIWLIVWGDQSIHGVFPKGSMAGLQHEDLGVGDALDSNNYRFRAYMDRWLWDCGLVVRDWRYGVRIASVDISALLADAGTPSTGANLIDLMTQAVHRVPQLNMGRAAWYMNRTCLEYLDMQSRKAVAGGGGLTYQNVDGKIIGSFRSVPIRTVDALVETETDPTA